MSQLYSNIFDLPTKYRPKKARERWQRSPTPAESWSDAEGANSDGEWEIEIIGEEVDEEGNVR